MFFSRRFSARAMVSPGMTRLPVISAPKTSFIFFSLYWTVFVCMPMNSAVFPLFIPASKTKVSRHLLGLIVRLALEVLQQIHEILFQIAAFELYIYAVAYESQFIFCKYSLVWEDASHRRPRLVYESEAVPRSFYGIYACDMENPYALVFFKLVEKSDAD